jgi:hypothetical protein
VKNERFRISSLPAIRAILVLLLFFIIGLAVYSSGLWAPFQLDDHVRIEDNPHVRLDHISLKGLKKAAMNKFSSHNRPIANLTFALNYYFHDYRVLGYRLVNIAVHILTAILFFVLARITLWIFQSRSGADSLCCVRPFHASFVALFAALIWLVHPVQTQSVTYIVQRMNSMAAMFYVLSLFLYVKGRLNQKRAFGPSKGGKDKDKFRSRYRYFWFGGSLLAWVLALGSKQIAVTLPFFVLLYEWYFFQDLSKDWLQSRLKYFLALAVAFGFIFLFFLGLNPLEKLQSIGDYSLNQFTFKERLLTQPGVVIHYLSLLFYPHPSRLNLDYDFPLSHS